MKRIMFCRTSFHLSGHARRWRPISITESNADVTLDECWLKLPNQTGGRNTACSTMLVAENHLSFMKTQQRNGRIPMFVWLNGPFIVSGVSWCIQKVCGVIFELVKSIFGRKKNGQIIIIAMPLRYTYLLF